MKSMKAKTSLTLKNIFNLDLNLNDNLDYLGLKGQELFFSVSDVLSIKEIKNLKGNGISGKLI